jgi:hypothetical protein
MMACSKNKEHWEKLCCITRGKSNRRAGVQEHRMKTPRTCLHLSVQVQTGKRERVSTERSDHRAGGQEHAVDEGKVRKHVEALESTIDERPWSLIAVALSYYGFASINLL